MNRSDATRFAASIVAGELVTRVAALLAQHAVVVAPLKGALLARTVYDGPAQRPLIDVDLLVPAPRFAEVLGILRADGFRAHPAASIRNDSERCLVHPGLPMPLDLHAALFAPGRYALPTAAVLGRALPDTALFGVEVLVLDPCDVLAHLVGHFAADHVDARDRVHVEDLVRLAGVHGLEPRRAASHLVACGLARAARYTLGVVHGATADDFARRTLGALPADPLGVALAALARSVVERAAPRSPAGALPAHLLNRTLLDAARAGAHAARRRLRPPRA